MKLERRASLMAELMGRARELGRLERLLQICDGNHWKYSALIARRDALKDRITVIGRTLDDIARRGC